MRNPYLNRAFSTLVFYVGWVICLKEAHLEHSYFGLFLVVAFIIYYLYHSSCRKADYLLLATVLSLGPLTDVFYSRIGLLQYHSYHSLASWLPPLWVFILWGLFAANIHLFSWLNHRKWAAIVMGAVGGPASYFSVIRLGGATPLQSLQETLVTIGGIWAILLPLCIWLNVYLKRQFSL